jgi:hypothetical protein
MLYLQLLTTTMSHYHHLYNAVQEMYSKYELEIEELEEINVHVSYTQRKLFRLELTEDNHIHNDKSNNKYRPSHSFNKHKPSRPYPNNPRRHQANFALQSQKFKKMKCWGCGYNHHLRDCPTTSNEDKQRLWEEHRTNLANKQHYRNTNSRLANNTDNSTNRCISSNSANIATTNCEHTKHSANTATDAQPPTTSAKPTKPKQTKLEMTRRKGIRGLAYATIHQANMATTPENLPIPTNDKDHNTDRAVTTTIGDWLIDSGCTAHMSNNINDFHVPLEPYETLVEVANGGVTHVQHRGKVDVLINDTYRPDNAIIVTLNNVLYVPGLTRRLLSVHEWNACGGWITLRPDRAILDVYSRDDECIASIEVPPVAGATGVDQGYQVNASQTRHAQSPKRTKVQQRLLHRRLGHRPISALLLAQRDNIWSDIEIIPEQDEFCETCKITTAQKANRGRQPLEDLEPVVPGTFVMVDIINNPSSRSITRNTFFPYYLAVTDVASRFFVPLGMQHKKAKTVFNAIHEWATCYGPSAISVNSPRYMETMTQYFEAKK